LTVDTSKLNEWLTLLTNIAVVAGIVFLAWEIQQNNHLLKSESRQALVTNDQESLLVAIDNVDIFQKLGQEEPLSQEDQYRVSFIYIVDLRNREFEYFQYQNGLLDEETWLSYRNILVFNHSSPRGRAWWDKVGRTVVNTEFAAMIDTLLDESPIIDIYDMAGNWDEGLVKGQLLRTKQETNAQ
jgi:hypothetical protein